MPARVDSLETVPVGLPFRQPYLTATGRLERREMIIVRLRAADATTGYGDAVPMSLRGGSSLADVRSELDEICGPAVAGLELGGDPARFVPAALHRCREAGAGPEALSGLGIALLDLAGKSGGRPVWRLLGANGCRAVRCNGTLGADEPDQAAAAAERMIRDGFETLKVKVGSGADLERIRAVRAAAGPGAKLRIDANGTWSVAGAVAALADLEPIGIELAEQPCATVEGLAEVRSRSAVRIVADESVNDLAEAERAIAIGAVDAATLKLAKVGGIHAALRIAEIVPSYLSSALDSVLGIAAAAHAAQVLPGRQFATGLAHGLATADLFADNVGDDRPFRGPEIRLTDEPGLGVDVNEDSIERLRLR